jgi:hypothetical protein
MSYTIKFTNEKTLAVIADQSIDDVSTSITLVGKNVNNYGEYVNNNFVGLLENFANLLEPNSPVVGQTWFDTSEGRLKVYSTGTFKPIGSPTLGTTAPLGAVKGDLWVDTTDNILKWYDGTGVNGWHATSKQYSDVYGKDGWQTEIVQTLPYNEDKQATVFYSNGSPWAIMAASTLTLAAGYVQYFGTATIYPGITLNPNIGAKFHGTATSAESVANISIDDYLLKNINNQETTGDLWFKTDEGIYVGTNTSLQVYANNGVAIIEGLNNTEPFEIRYNSYDLGNRTAIHIDPTNDRIGIFTTTPAVAFDVNGDVHITGNLTVLGTQTSLEVVTLKVEDANIELNNRIGSTSTDENANSGGITLHGTTDKSITYNFEFEAWTSNISIDLYSDAQTYKISGTDVIKKDPLRAGYQLAMDVISAPGLINLPIQPTFQAGNLIFSGDIIGTIVSPLTDVKFRPTSGYLNLTTDVAGITTSSAKIIGMGATLDTDGDDTAVSKGYFEGRLSSALGGFAGRKPYILALDVTNFADLDDDILTYLNLSVPVDGFGDPYYEQPDGARCSVVCTRYIQRPVTEFLTIDTNTGSTTASFITTVVYTGTSATSFISTITYVNKNVFFGDNFSVAGSVTVTPLSPIIQRFVRVYQVITGQWTYSFNADNEYLESTDPIFVSMPSNAVKQLTISPTTSSLTTIELASLAGVRRGHVVTGGYLNTGTTATTVLNIITASNAVEISIPAIAPMLAGTTITFAYSPGATIYMNAKGPATLGSGSNAVIFDRQTQLNTIQGVLVDPITATSYLSTVTVGIYVTSVNIGSTGTSTNWKISLSEPF